MSATSSDIRMIISLPQSVIEKYSKQADHLGRTIEQELESRLRLFQDVDSTKPIIIQDHERQKIEKLLGKNFNDSESLVASIIRISILQVGGFNIPLSVRLMERLQSRCIGMPFEKFITTTVTRLLEEFAGMR